MAFKEVPDGARARVVRAYGLVPDVEVDIARLSQVFVNLLVNAAHALSEENAMSNEITITTCTDADGRAIIEIRDTGHGIPEDVLPHVFDAFFTTKPVGAGTGLGLSIFRNFVLRMQGEITLSSSGGDGTTVRIVLPPASRKTTQSLP